MIYIDCIFPYSCLGYVSLNMTKGGHKQMKLIVTVALNMLIANWAYVFLQMTKGGHYWMTLIVTVALKMLKVII